MSVRPRGGQAGMPILPLGKPAPRGHRTLKGLHIGGRPPAPGLKPPAAMAGKRGPEIRARFKISPRQNRLHKNYVGHPAEERRKPPSPLTTFIMDVSRIQEVRQHGKSD